MRRLAGVLVAALAFSLALAVVAAESPAVGVKIKTKRISPPSPFSPNPACAEENPGFSPGFAQESSLAVNPRDPSHILVSWIQDARATDTVMVSHDGGRSFSRVFVPGLSACTGGDANFVSDPGVDFTANGRMAYFTAIRVSFTGTSLADPEAAAAAASPSMGVSRSFNGGISWEVPSLVQQPTGQFFDLPRLTAHPRNPKKAYYLFNLRQPPDFSRGYSVVSTTNNAGRSWSPVRVLFDPQTPNSWPAINKLLVNRDGSLVVIFPLVGGGPEVPTQEMAIRSTNGGRTWSAPVTIGSIQTLNVYDPVTNTPLNTYPGYPSETVAPNGDVYVSWAETGATPSSPSAIAVARSADGGRHWRTHRIVVHAQSALPTVEVAGDGTVGVLYYKIAPASVGGFWATRVVLATSRDHGRHFRRHTVVKPFNLLSAGSKGRPCCFLGDYEGSGRLPHGFAFAYSVGKPQALNNVDVYFTRVTTSGGTRNAKHGKGK
jgi:hypothetical protein